MCVLSGVAITIAMATATASISDITNSPRIQREAIAHMLKEVPLIDG
jgi:hypothetical protein